jgi:hypothetical protein
LPDTFQAKGWRYPIGSVPQPYGTDQQAATRPRQSPIPLAHDDGFVHSLITTDGVTMHNRGAQKRRRELWLDVLLIVLEKAGIFFVPLCGSAIRLSSAAISSNLARLGRVERFTRRLGTESRGVAMGIVLPD